MDIGTMRAPFIRLHTPDIFYSASQCICFWDDEEWWEERREERRKGVELAHPRLCSVVLYSKEQEAEHERLRANAIRAAALEGIKI